MLIWFLIAVLTILVAGFVLRPLLARDGHFDPRSAHDMTVYRDQLAEIDADLDRNLIRADEAEAARLEISRRLLAAAGALGESGAGAMSGSNAGKALRPAAYGGLAAFAAIALGSYLSLGSPQIPDQPLAARIAAAPEGQRIEVMIRQVEERLRANPEDGVGWDVVAPIYMRMRRFPDAAQAYANAMRLLGETPKRLIGFGEALVISSDGIVDDRARTAFERAVSADTTRLEPRFWLAIAAEQDGKLEQARREFEALLAVGEADAPWRPLVADRLAAITAALAGASAKPAAPASVPPSTPAPSAGSQSETARGPSASDIAAAGQMTQDDRNQMIEQMVAGLAERLSDNGRDLKGWKMLMRSYMMLNKPDQARQSFQKAAEIFADDAASLSDLRQHAGELGISG